MKSVTINMGHTLTGGDIGARGLNAYKEEVLTREVGIELSNILREEGITTSASYCDNASTLQQSLNIQISKCNNPLSDMNICIHFNAFKDPDANGSEIYTYNGVKHIEAERILNELNMLGFKNRGIKSANFALITQTKAKTLYIEICFLTNIHDVSILKSVGSRGIALAIARGLLGKDIKDNPITNDIISPNVVPNEIYKIPNTDGYVEQTADGRLIIHKDKYNYIAIGNGFIDLYWDDLKGNKGKKRLTD